MERDLRIAVFGQKRLSREGGVEIVVKELCTRMAQQGCQVTCYNRSGHHVSGAEYDDIDNTNYEGIRQKSVPTIEKKGAEIANLQYMNKVNEDNRAFLHDINKFICTVAGLIEEGENQEVKDIMEHLGVRIQNLQKSVYCEHPILNSILCERKFLAESKDISYRITLGNDLRLDFLEELDLISIVGNLLDNALEAAEKTEDGRYVECRMYMGNAGHFLVMEFCNGYVVPLLKDKDRYISTKRDADSHGIGLHTVGKLVKKYAGIMRVEAGEREFSVKLIFTIK